MTGPAAYDYILHRELPLASLPHEIYRNGTDDDPTTPIGPKTGERNGLVSAPLPRARPDSSIRPRSIALPPGCNSVPASAGREAEPALSASAAEPGTN
jgi:hypothetical protein